MVALLDGLNFGLVRDDYSERWTRATENAPRALFERASWDEWLVCLPDGDPWLVSLRREQDDFTGDCQAPPDADREHDRCPGHQWHDGPCAHLCAVRVASWCNREGFEEITDTRGRPVRILDVEDAELARVDNAIERSLMADGGER